MSDSHTPAGRRLRYSLYLPFILILSVALVLAACTQEDDEEPTPSGDVVPATPTPTFTPIPTIDFMPTPTPVPSTQIQTDDDDETLALISSQLTPYVDDLYGYSLRVPVTWTSERQGRNPLGVATSFDTGSEEILAQTIVLFRAEPVVAANFALEQLTPLAGLSGYRTIIESSIELDDGTEAYQVLYGYGTGSNEYRGAITVVARGTAGMGIQTQAPRTIYERNFDVLDSVSTSIRTVTPQPFGAPLNDTIVLFLDGGPLTLDPGISTDAASTQYIRQIFSGLVRLNTDLIPEPDLATWTVSDDGTVYTFTIKDGAQFHDGTPVTAQDFIFSWERAMNRNLPPVGGSAGSYLDDIVGAKEYHAGEADSISGLAAPNESTLVVTIDEAKSYFLSKLTHSAAYVVLEANVPEVPSPRLVEDDDDSTDGDSSSTSDSEDEAPPDPWYYTAIGTGPYRLTEWSQARAMHLTVFPGYTGPAHDIGNVVFRFHAGISTNMVEEGFVDATTLLGLADYDALVEEDSSLLDQITRTESLSVHYLAFNTVTGPEETDAPFADPDVRRAFLMAVDREAIFEEHGASGIEIAHGFMPPGLPGHDADIEEITYDPDAAKLLFDTTDFGQLSEEEKTVYVAGSGDTGPIFRAIFTQWQDNLGVRIQYQALGQAYFYQLPQVIQIGYHIYSYGWLADYPDPHNFLDVLFHRESTSNEGKAGSAAIDKLLEEARTAGEGRLEQYQEIERRMMQIAIAFPLYFGTDFILVSDRVANLEIDAQGFLRLEDAELED